MSEMTPVAHATESSDAADDAAAAFDRLGRRIAGLIATTEGFAARQQEIQGRDYTQDLARIHDAQQRFRKAIETLDQRPAMQMTVEKIAGSIEQAAAGARRADHDALEHARSRFLASITTLENFKTHAVAVNKQRYGLALAALAILWIGAMFGNFAMLSIDRMAPPSWHWPEQRAVAALDTNAWEAGSILMQLDSPRGWKALMAAGQLSRDNAAAITDCRAKAVSAGQAVKCTTVVEATVG